MIKFKVIEIFKRIYLEQFGDGWKYFENGDQYYMRTKKPVSTVSYNTMEFLVKKCDELLEAHKISRYMLIRHFAEADEAKDHTHVLLIPNTLIDTMAFQEHFKELDLEHPTRKPLGCIDFRLTNDIDEWVLYVEHFPPYLASKLESREFIYSKDDFIYSDEDTFEWDYRHAHNGSEWAKRNKLLQMLNNPEVDPVNLILNGTVPFNQSSQLNAFNYMKYHYGKLDRGNYGNHEIDVDTEVEYDKIGSDNDLSDKEFFNDTIYRINR